MNRQPIPRPSGSTSSGSASSGPSSSGPPPLDRSRKRAALACQACHERKVRCNVTLAGPPCANCVCDGISCEIVARGRGLRRHRMASMLVQQQQQQQPHPQPHHHQQQHQGGPGSTSVASNHGTECFALSPVLPVPVASPRHSPTSVPNMLRTPESGPVLPASHDTAQTARTCPADGTARSLSVASSAEEIQVLPACPKPAGLVEPPSQQEEGAEFSAILDEENDESATMLYSGDQLGLGLVVDICKPHRPFRSNHYLIPRAAAAAGMSALLPEDLAALHAKGCFSLPSSVVSERLLRCYCHHVHPFLPIVDMASFLQQYEAGGAKKVNLLLLWGMFFAATNFLDDETVALAGYTSRKAMKRTLYRRAKGLYDADYEKDKIPLIQAVLLLAYWYADSEDRDGSWHWIGIAISLCQTIGLHRRTKRPRYYSSVSSSSSAHSSSSALSSTSSSASLSGSSSSTTTTTTSDGPPWQILWWAGYFRDTWLSFGMGRPTRINLADCDTPVPTADDVQALTAGLPPHLAAKYLPPDPDHMLPRMWAALLETTFALGAILVHHYRAQAGTEVSTSSSSSNGNAAESRGRQCHGLAQLVRQDQERLRQCRLGFPAEEAAACESSEVVLLHLYHLHVYYEACVIALHRPYMAGRPGSEDDDPHARERDDRDKGTASSSTPGWKARSLQCSKIAASNITSVLNKITVSCMLENCHAMMVTAIIPALQIHLLGCVSGHALARRLGQHHLDICLLVLRELRRTYWAADFMYLLFSKARRQLDGPASDDRASRGRPHKPRAEQRITPAVLAADCPSTTADTPSAPSSCALDMPLDIDLALAFDLVPFQDYGGLGSLGGRPVSPPSGGLRFDGADTDMNVLFEGDDFSAFLS